MARKKLTPLEQIQADCAALNGLDRATFRHWLITDEHSPAYQLFCSTVADIFKLQERLEKAEKPRRGPDTADPYLVLRLREKLLWREVAAEMDISVSAARRRHDRAKARLAKETAPYISVYP